jgi:hypothetical protein
MRLRAKALRWFLSGGGMHFLIKKLAHGTLCVLSLFFLVSVIMCIRSYGNFEDIDFVVVEFSKGSGEFVVSNLDLKSSNGIIGCVYMMRTCPAPTDEPSLLSLELEANRNWEFEWVSTRGIESVPGKMLAPAAWYFELRQWGYETKDWTGESVRHRGYTANWVLVAIALGVLPILFLVRSAKQVLRTNSRRRSGLCIACGYDRTKTEGRCPECGAI